MTIDTDSLNRSTDLLALAGRDTNLERVATTDGGEYAGPCPFCGGRDRFRVQPNAPDGPRWLCRHCTLGKWNDPIAYLMQRESCDFRRACELLGAAESLPTRPRQAAPEPLPLHVGPPPVEWQARARAAIEIFEHNLWAAEGERARAWLHGRGLTDETLRHWRIGYNLGGLCEWRKVAGLSVPCGIVLPCEIGGAVWYVKVRRPAGEPKYLQVKRPEGHYAAALFGADTFTGHDTAVLCEGEFDAMLLEQEAGDLAGVGTLGSATARLDVGAWGACLLTLARLLIAYDLDDSGEQGAQRWAELTARARRVAVPRLRPGDKDITDFWRAGGKLRDWLSFELVRLGVQDLGSKSPKSAAPIAGSDEQPASMDDEGQNEEAIVLLDDLHEYLTAGGETVISGEWPRGERRPTLFVESISPEATNEQPTSEPEIA